MRQIVFVHGMFQNPRSWEEWTRFFTERGYECIVPAWPLHEDEPATLRANPPEELGDLHLCEILARVEQSLADLDAPIMIGHSVGGLITQIMLNRGLVSAGVAISSVAPNDMIDFDWGFIKNSALIANPFKGNEPIFMDEKTFHRSFANTLTREQAGRAYAEYATHDSRNVLRDCLGSDGRIDLAHSHGPLLLIGGEKDEIIPADLVRKNAAAYDDRVGIVEHKEFSGRSHFICGEPGWEEVALYVADWLEQVAIHPSGSFYGEGFSAFR
ncbi:Lysophospholipase, alpha-beta hydrolase superfamily [Devosia crocina]|uniref:Lysophospholipase, alpha-beta hydrolase superfamily n=1 Tax=Devosia crocina TaxID=429728 RepID=A0A1I7NM53_9HYPH|nr:alpha/beta fold hydrolase [Devosia crocina]SFV35751.1 Lysophospholipase, alpha-beta hydrolase superfamily [Devosia crocina]